MRRATWRSISYLSAEGEPPERYNKMSEELDNISLQIDIGEQEDEDGNGSEAAENVKVMVRCRPLLRSNERDSGLQVDEIQRCVQVDGRQFHYDATFGASTNNDQVYMRSVRELVESAFRGYNCTVFLYGQTGTGKTYTHSSLASSSFSHLFSLIQSSGTQSRFLIRASYYELYNEDIRDLLSSSNKPLELRESTARGVYVRDLTCYLVNNLAELERLKRLGEKKRATAATRMNEHSSRSHSIFSITIETVEEPPSVKGSAGSSRAVRVGRLHLIDLAGSERQSKSGSTGIRLKEAARINLSLTCLSLVIRALTDKTSTHVPYRNSKLTRLLSGSLGGNSKTLLIACISPSKASLDETLNTLRFASRTKRIKNKALVNEDAKDALLRKYRLQIERLRSKLREQQVKTGSDGAQQQSDAVERLLDDAQSQQQSAALQQLRLLRDKIMVGGENLLEKAELHERLLEASKVELEEKRQREAELRSSLEKKRLKMEQMALSKGSLESQVISLDEKLARAVQLYRRTKDEQRDLVSEHQLLKENLLQTIRATSREIKYADCIIQDFIPPEELDLINTCAKCDEASGEWQIKYVALGGNNIAQTRRLDEGRFSSSSNDVGGGTETELKSSARADPYLRLKELVS